MSTEINMALFRGARQYEEILVNGKLFKLEPAKIICVILELQDDFFNKMSSIEEGIGEITKAYHNRQNVSFFDEEETCIQYALTLKDILMNHRGIVLSQEEEMLLNLMITLPCYEVYKYADDHSVRLRAGEEYLKEINSALRMNDGTPDPRIESYKIAEEKAREYDNESAAWSHFLLFLRESEHNELWRFVTDIIFGSAGTGKNYQRLFNESIAELQNVRQELRRAVGENDARTLEMLKHRLTGPRVISDNYRVEELPPRANKRYGKIYGVVSFTEIVLAEFNLLDEMNRRIKKCKLCGKFFVPYQTDSKYCRNPNLKYDGKLCATIGSRITYKQRHGIYDSPIGKEYEKRYKTYRAWIDQNEEALRSKFSRRYGSNLIADAKKEIEEKRKGIEAEIEHNYEEWKTSAKNAMIRWERGEIDETECLKWIKLPTPFERSPMLRELKDSLDDYNDKRYW